VVDYESTLAGYWPGAPPMNDQEAVQLKNGLLQRLVTDAQMLGEQWKSLPIDLDVVFQGLTGLIGSQAEKVTLAAMHQEESRYSGTTLTDMRSNLAGTRAIYQLFIPWLDTKPFGMNTNKNAIAALDSVDERYSEIPGDAVPAPPETWKATGQQSPADLATPFGALYSAVSQAADANRAGSAVDAMNHVAWALGLSTAPAN
jgi:hypothetical protein